MIGAKRKIRAFNPATAIELEPDFAAGSESDVDRACLLAQTAFDSNRETSLETRAQFPRPIATEIPEPGNALVDRASAETGLTRARIESEPGRNRRTVSAALRPFLLVMEGAPRPGIVTAMPLSDATKIGA